MSKYDNFARNDIFKKDSQGNSVYFMMGQLSPGIIVNDSITQNKLVDLEGYKYFFLPFHKNKNFLKSRGLIIPPIIIPILVFTFLVLVISSILFPELKIIETDKDFGLIMFIMGFSSYIIIGLTYLRKIQKLLKGLPLISKKEKNWIFDKGRTSQKNTTQETNIHPSAPKEKFKFEFRHIFYTITFICIAFPLIFFIGSIFYSILFDSK
ncbi:hypothetical protein Arnit_3075 [Arcobacter nitrofigilis DSM 7299]|uniref:Uncharacterized protein n=1 Tax=Arcobacter nitrofigilis (strain ATCC 33309 / DSM 7299 / CCUG 15893 / LMG 7604 / NCTC 12251 / CI) TaxID=572480 RepID=D5V7V2_ARCNC|nr:hypothetical protein [Arcobacter nitrofigilis]ADG94722.1 hypothetical protein Arnit_3075 [Arcobacter nitrofigilis DSM 7299]